MSEQPYGAVEPDPTSPDPEEDTALDTRGGRATTAISVVGLVLALVGFAWQSSYEAREGWWALGEHVAVEPDDTGWARTTLQTDDAELDLAFRLDEAHVLSGVDGQPAPAGYVYLSLTIEVTSTETQTYRTCEVQVSDAEGRLFAAGREVPSGDGYEWDLMCGTDDPDEDPIPSSQSVLVLLPEDAEPVAARVTSPAFPPASFVDLPL